MGRRSNNAAKKDAPIMLLGEEHVIGMEPKQFAATTDVPPKLETEKEFVLGTGQQLQLESCAVQRGAQAKQIEEGSVTGMGGSTPIRNAAKTGAQTKPKMEECAGCERRIVCEAWGKGQGVQSRGMQQPSLERRSVLDAWREPDCQNLRP